MNKHILTSEVQAFLQANRHQNPSSIALKKSPFEKVSSSELASQIDGYQRALKKLPTWANTERIYFPDKINMEQCSSEQTALVKKNLIKKGSKVVDVTGGFSVDTCYLAQQAASIVHCELNEKLSEIVAHNAQQLGVTNLTALATDGVAYIQSLPEGALDYIYIDPSRRVNHAKVFLLEDCEPNIVALQDMFLTRATSIICKLSPLMDISTALSRLKHVREVYVISVDGDCKELLFVQERSFVGEPSIKAIRLVGEKQQEITFTPSEEKAQEVESLPPAAYLYDPDVAITKAGAFKIITKKFEVGKIHQHTHLYTAEKFVSDFPGRSFVIQGVYPISSFKKNNVFKQANVVSKNFPMKVDDIRKKFKIKDGGKDFLYFTTDHKDNHTVLHVTKTS